MRAEGSSRPQARTAPPHCQPRQQEATPGRRRGLKRGGGDHSVRSQHPSDHKCVAEVPNLYRLLHHVLENTRALDASHGCSKSELPETPGDEEAAFTC